jgi:hypothetical protein
LCNEAHNEPTKFVLTFTLESFDDSILLWYDVASFCKRRDSSSPLQKPQNENILLSQLLPDNQILKSIISVGCNEYSNELDFSTKCVGFFGQFSYCWLLRNESQSSFKCITLEFHLYFVVVLSFEGRAEAENFFIERTLVLGE